MNMTLSEFLAHEAKIEAGKLARMPRPARCAPVAASEGSKPVQTPASLPTGEREQIWTVPVDPVPAPRMTSRDVWLKPRRPCVQRYWDFRAALRAAVGSLETVPDVVDVTFRIPMPKSWSAAKRAAMMGTTHRNRPDGDNLFKAVADALWEEDCGISDGSFGKEWAATGSIEIYARWL